MRSYATLFALIAATLLLIIAYKGPSHFTLFSLSKTSGCVRNVSVGSKDNDTQQICVKDYFASILLVIIYNHPHYDSVPVLQEFYEPVFPNIFFCGPPGKQSFYNVTQIQINRGIFGYECLSEAIRRHHGYDGFFYINDDVILNYWNLFNSRFHKELIWESNNQFGRVDLDDDIPTNWYWWISPYGFNNCKAAILEVEALASNFKIYRNMYSTFLLNGNQTRYAYNGRSDILYIPRKYAMNFQELASIFYKHNVFLEISVPTILHFLSPFNEIYTLDGYYIPGDVRKNDSRVIDSRYFWVLYLNNPKLWFIHPFKLHHKRNKNRDLNMALMKSILVAKTKILTQC